MQIGLVSPLYESVPPKFYGGTERVVAYLADALVELGHEVTLFSAADAATKARLVAVRDQSIRLDPFPLKSDIAAHLNQLHEVRKRARRFDVIHFHLDLLHLPLFADMARRTITTLHGRLDYKDLPDAYRRWPDYPLVSISDSQRAPLIAANWLGTVHHGLPLDLCRYSPRPAGGYLAFLGRISPEKRPDRAIALAKATGIPLKIAAKVDAVDRAYFQDRIEPLTRDPLIEFIGEIGEQEKSAFLGDAIALVFLIDWPEPFGLAMIEAMACGTPVIAWNMGSVPEIVEDGVTGRIVASESEAIGAVQTVAALDRCRIRREFERRFSSTIMANNYLRLYRRLAGAEKQAELDEVE